MHKYNSLSAFRADVAAILRTQQAGIAFARGFQDFSSTSLFPIRQIVPDGDKSTRKLYMGKYSTDVLVGSPTPSGCNEPNTITFGQGGSSYYQGISEEALALEICKEDCSP